MISTKEYTELEALLLIHGMKFLLGYCKGTYQFPGGYLEEGETIEECLKKRGARRNGTCYK